MKTINNKIKLAVISIFTVSVFSACSGGGGGSDASFANSEQKDNINIDCILTPNSADIATYIDLFSGDTIVKVDNNATVSIYHDVTGSKKICRVSGDSYILRAN